MFEAVQLYKKYNILEYKCKEVTTRIINYLKEHKITKDMHNAQKAKYIKLPYTNSNITVGISALCICWEGGLFDSFH